MQQAVKINCRGAEEVRLRDLIPFQGILKTLPEENYQKCKEEILRDGFCEPVSTWKRDGHWIILNGHQRVTTLVRMQEEGFIIPPIPVSIVFVRDEQQANDLVLALTAQFGVMTNESLANFFRERNIPKDTLDRYPHRDTDTAEVIRLIDEPTRVPEEGAGQEDEDAVPELAVDPRVARGDVFRLGDHLIVCGFAEDPTCYAKLGFANTRADLVVTDPPYNLAGEAEMLAVSELRGDSYGRLKDADWDKDFSPEVPMKLIVACASPEASFYFFTSHFLFDRIYRALKPEVEYAGYCVWSKSNPMPSLAKRHWTWNTELVVYGARKGHVFNFPEQGNALSTWTHSKIAKAEFHATQKPVGVIEHPILHSSNPGAIVLDAFGGSGTTLIACEKLKRQCRMIEISPAYVRVTIERWEKLTGKEAVKLPTPSVPSPA